MWLAAVEPEMPVNIYKPDWMERAACAGDNPNLFFPEPGDSSAVIKAAKRVCALCPVRVECLEYALQYDGMPGIWGGKTQRERRKLFAERLRTTPKK